MEVEAGLGGLRTSLESWKLQRGWKQVRQALSGESRLHSSFGSHYAKVKEVATWHYSGQSSEGRGVEEV